MTGDATRAHLIEFIERSPGIHISELCRTADLAWGTVQHHLHRLESEGRIRLQRDGRVTRLFSGATSDRDVTLLSLLHRDISAQIVVNLARMPQAGIQDLSDALQVSRKTIRRHLATLVDAGVVDREGGYRGLFELAGRIALRSPHSDAATSGAALPFP